MDCKSYRIELTGHNGTTGKAVASGLAVLYQVNGGSMQLYLKTLRRPLIFLRQFGQGFLNSSRRSSHTAHSRK